MEKRSLPEEEDAAGLMEQFTQGGDFEESNSSFSRPGVVKAANHDASQVHTGSFVNDNWVDSGVDGFNLTTYPDFEDDMDFLNPNWLAGVMDPPDMIADADAEAAVKRPTESVPMPNWHIDESQHMRGGFAPQAYGWNSAASDLESMTAISDGSNTQQCVDSSYPQAMQYAWEFPPYGPPAMQTTPPITFPTHPMSYPVSGSIFLWSYGFRRQFAATVIRQGEISIRAGPELAIDQRELPENSSGGGTVEWISSRSCLRCEAAERSR